MIFWIKMVEYWGFDKHLSQFGKAHSSSGCKKAQFYLFRLRQISIFFSNLIINFILYFIVMRSSTVTTNPDSTHPGLYQRLSTPWSLQHQGKWCSYLTESLDELLIKVCKSEEDLDISYWLKFRSLLNYLDFFVLYAYAFWQYYIAEEPNLFLVITTLF